MLGPNLASAGGGGVFKRWGLLRGRSSSHGGLPEVDTKPQPLLCLPFIPNRHEVSNSAPSHIPLLCVALIKLYLCLL